ncbi:MAG: hypothetical protein ACTSRG_23855 [Candidatus Helarchaeota archaeon]
MSSSNSQVKQIICFSIIYTAGLLIILLWGEFYFQYLLGNVLALVGFFYYVNYLMKYDVKNKHFTSFFFITLLFFWIRIPFIFKTTLLTPDFNIYYRTAIQFLNNKIPFLFSGLGYGPVYWLFLFSIALITNGDYFSIKIFFVFLDFLNLVMLYFISRQLKIKGSYKICLLYTLIPISLIQFAWNGHNDTGMILLVLISIYFVLKNKDMFAGIFLFLGIAYKFYAVFILPVYLIYYYKHSESISQFFKKIIITYSPILIIAGGLFIYNRWLILGIFYGALLQGSRTPVLGLMSTLNGANNIRSIAGIVILYSSYFTDAIPTAIPILLYMTKDVFMITDILELTWIFFAILLFFAFKDNIIKNPLYLSIPLTPIIIYFLEVFIQYPIYNILLLNFSILMLLLFLLAYYYKVLKFEDLSRENLIIPIFYVLYLFISIFWVSYPWYFLWLIPVMFLYAFKIKQGKFMIYIIVFNSFITSLFWFRGIQFTELIFVLLIFILLVNIFLFLKILEYKDIYHQNQSKIFEKINQKVPKFLDFNINGLFEKTIPFNSALIVFFLISISNMILITVQLLILTPILPTLDFLNNYFLSVFYQSAILK